MRATIRVAMAVVLATTLSCTKNVARVHELPLARLNPTSYVFELPAREIKERAKSALSGSDAVEQAFGKRPYRDPVLAADDEVQFADSFAVAEAGAAPQVQLLSRPDNRNDLYVDTQGSPLWPSPVYRGRGGGLPFIAAFHVHLAALGPDRTMVSVTAIDPQVMNGMKWMIGSCGPGYAWRYEPVAPTSVEEYALLLFLGRAMHIEAMPEIMVPAPASQVP